MFLKINFVHPTSVSILWMQIESLIYLLHSANESKIIANIFLNHPLRLSIVGSALIPWIYMYQFWHTLQEDGSRYQFRFSLGTKELTMNVADFKRIFQPPQATDKNHVGFVDAPTFGQMVQSFHHNLGFSLPLRNASNFKSKGLPQPWQTLCKIFAQDPDTRIEPKSDKESLEAEIDADLVPIISNEEEEESAEEMLIRRRREKGKGIEESRSSPPPTPIRSPRTHIAPLSMDKETLQELTAITEDAPSSVDKEKLQELMVTDLTPSSSTPFLDPRQNLKHVTFMTRKSFNELYEMLYRALKEMLPSMVNEEVNKISKSIVPVYVAEGYLVERKKTQDDVVAMIVEAIKKEYENLHAEVISQVNDVVANHIPPQFEGIIAATAYRPSTICLRDHDDYQDDDARPEGENSAKRQKTSEHGTYSVGESSSGQAIDHDQNLSGLGTQEQLDAFDAWMEDVGTDDDDVPNDKIS
ncbi:hypothetical protein Tco_1153662 [Tanacetum coccineum]